MERTTDVRQNKNTPSSPARPNWWIIAPVVWAVPATIAVLQSLVPVAMYATNGVGRRHWILAAMQFPRYFLWAPITPLIFAAVRRFPIRKTGLGRSIAIHVGIALLCIAFVEGLTALLQWLLLVNVMLEQPPRVGYGAVAVGLGLLLPRLSIDLLAYSAVVAVASALDYQERLRDETVRFAQLERDLSEAQVQAIKMQVQPHFLFNTLHAVNVLIEKEPTAATRMVTRLGDLLRHTLSRAAVAEVPLRTELDVLQLYLEIERTRFRDRLTVRVDAPSETLDALVPDLILQPLAENAIKHGIESDTGAGSVVVKASRVGESLVIEVHDTGRGPGEDIIDRVGLTTVRARLARLYADEHEFTLAAGPDGGGVARIRIPFRTARG